MENLTEIQINELKKQMSILWHEIQTSEGAESWLIINDFINNQSIKNEI